MQAGLKIGPVEINRFHLLRVAYVVGIGSIAFGIFAAVQVLDVDKTAAKVTSEIEARTAEASARLENIQAEAEAARKKAEADADAAIGKAQREADALRKQAEADAEAIRRSYVQAAKTANAELTAATAEIISLYDEARKLYTELLRTGIGNASDPVAIRQWENRLRDFQRRFSETATQAWEKRVAELQTQIDSQQQP
jgi:regulator of protease activity HflC (stomatin/prohibitin superfamily)